MRLRRKMKGHELIVKLRENPDADVVMVIEMPDATVVTAEVRDVIVSDASADGNELLLTSW
jgi:hypothetical protein